MCQCQSSEDRKCRVCGCTDTRACPGGCWWVEWDLCSACHDVSTEPKGIAAPEYRGDRFVFDDESDDFEEEIEEPDTPDLGPCCCCGGTESVRNIVCLSRRAPVPGTGWACLQCGLPPEGAIYVACDRCVEDNVRPREVVHGHAAAKGRLPIDRLAAEEFRHDMSRHPGEEDGLDEAGEDLHVTRCMPGDVLAERPGFDDDDDYEEG